MLRTALFIACIYYPRTQGNVIRLVSHICTKKFVIERTRDLIYLKFVGIDFFSKIISPSAGENSSDSA